MLVVTSIFGLLMVLILGFYIEGTKVPGRQDKYSASYSRVVQVLVGVGDRVARGQVVAILEAMKTELRIAAPADGIVAHLGCAPGDSVEEGTEFVTLAPPDEGATPP